MVVRCAWCGTENSGSSAGIQSDFEVSHGICEECEGKLISAEGRTDPTPDKLI